MARMLGEPKTEPGRAADDGTTSDLHDRDAFDAFCSHRSSGWVGPPQVLALESFPAPVDARRPDQRLAGVAPLPAPRPTDADLPRGVAAPPSVVAAVDQTDHGLTRDDDELLDQIGCSSRDLGRRHAAPVAVHDTRAPSSRIGAFVQGGATRGSFVVDERDARALIDEAALAVEPAGLDAEPGPSSWPPSTDPVVEDHGASGITAAGVLPRS